MVKLSPKNAKNGAGSPPFAPMTARTSILTANAALISSSSGERMSKLDSSRVSKMSTVKPNSKQLLYTASLFSGKA